MATDPLNVTSDRIQSAVDELFEEELRMLQDLVRIPSLVGQPGEAEVQHYMDRVLREELRLTSVDKWEIALEDVQGKPGSSPIVGEWRDKWGVVGVHKPSGEPKGKSLIFNGHVDVVPTGPVDLWTHAPFDPVVEGGWLYGRGCGDMKAGVVAMVYAFKALQHMGLQPASEVQFHSVIDEECTGNGALAALGRGYRADACVIPEPFPFVMTAQLGVLWLHIECTGRPGHVLDTSKGVNAIEGAMELYRRMKALAEEWNAPDICHPAYTSTPHPINFNVGRIEGGEWGSTVPSRCTITVRAGFFPDKSVSAVQKTLEAFVADASKEIGITSRVSYSGFTSDGCTVDPDGDLVRGLAQAYKAAAVEAADVPLRPVTCTTDARVYQHIGGIPTTCFGPHSVKNIHGIDERLSLQSLKDVTRVLCMFLVQWCGVELVPEAAEHPRKKPRVC